MKIHKLINQKSILKGNRPNNLFQSQNFLAYPQKVKVLMNPSYSGQQRQDYLSAREIPWKGNTFMHFSPDGGS